MKSAEAYVADQAGRKRRKRSQQTTKRLPKPVNRNVSLLSNASISSSFTDLIGDGSDVNPSPFECSAAAECESVPVFDSFTHAAIDLTDEEDLSSDIECGVEEDSSSSLSCSSVSDERAEEELNNLLYDALLDSDDRPLHSATHHTVHDFSADLLHFFRDARLPNNLRHRLLLLFHTYMPVPNNLPKSTDELISKYSLLLFVLASVPIAPLHFGQKSEDQLRRSRELNQSFLGAVGISEFHRTERICGRCCSSIQTGRCTNSDCVNNDVACVNKDGFVDVVTFDVEQQLRLLYQKNSDILTRYQSEARHRSMSDQEDIVGGKVYQTLLSTNPDFCFSVMLHSDGIPLYRSRTCSAWPILGAVVELPPFCRNRCDNILLLSVWIGKEKPNFDVILSKLSQQLMHLKETWRSKNRSSSGFTCSECLISCRVIDMVIVSSSVCVDRQGEAEFRCHPFEALSTAHYAKTGTGEYLKWTWRSKWKSKFIRVYFPMLMGDMPALSDMVKFVLPNAYFVCMFCKSKGIYSHEGHCIVYPSGTNAELRSHIDFDRAAQTSTGSARVLKEKLAGVKGVSAFKDLLDVPMPHSLVIDAMHTVFLCHSKKLLAHLQTRISKEDLQIISRRMRSLRYVHDVLRRPRAFGSVEKWEASEIRVFILYLALPMLVEYLSEEESGDLALYTVILRLLHDEWHKDADRCKVVSSLIDLYISNLTGKFSRKICPPKLLTISTHTHTHLPIQCQKFGRLDWLQNFVFESFLGYVKSFVKGPHGAGEQIAFGFTLKFVLNKLGKHARQYGHFQIDENTFGSNIIHLGQHLALNKFLLGHHHSQDKIVVFCRLYLFNTTFHSFLFSRKGHTCSYLVSYSKDDAICADKCYPLPSSVQHNFSLVSFLSERAHL